MSMLFGNVHTHIALSGNLGVYVKNPAFGAFGLFFAVWGEDDKIGKFYKKFVYNTRLDIIF